MERTNTMTVYSDVEKINKMAAVNAAVRANFYAVQKLRNQQGWYDRIWDQFDFRGSQRDALLAGEMITAENDSCVAFYQLTPVGDLLVVAVRSGETKCMVINRITGEKRACFYVAQPFEEEED